MMVKNEEGLGFVRDDHHPLDDIVFTVGGAYEALDIDTKRAIDMGTMLPLKIHQRGEGSIKPGRYGFVSKFGTEECMIDFLKTFAGGKEK